MEKRTPLLSFKLCDFFTMSDIGIMLIVIVYSALDIIFYEKIPKASFNILLNATLILTVFGLATSDKLHGGSIFKITRQFYVIPVVYLMYEQVQTYIPIVHHVDFDASLIKIDHFIFGVNPTEWLSQFSFPALTEYFQATYMVFYLLPITQAINLYYVKKYSALEDFAYTLSISFFVSFLLYFIFPAIGPRFTLHDFSHMNVELPGLWLTEPLRNIVNVGGGIVSGTANPAEIVNRDCMPSGHTMMTLVNIILGFRNRSYFRWVFLVIGGSLIFSTVYLRYHYVIDVIAGSFCAVFMIWFAPRLKNWITTHTNILKK